MFFVFVSERPCDKTSVCVKVSVCHCVCVKVSLCKGNLLFAPGAIETTFLEAHVDGGTTAPWVAAGFHTWHGLALVCFCAVKSKPQNVSTSKWCPTVCECKNKSTETVRDLLMRMLQVQHRDAAQVNQICLGLCGVGSICLNSPMQMHSLIVFSHAVALINMISLPSCSTVFLWWAALDHHSFCFDYANATIHGNLLKLM